MNPAGDDPLAQLRDIQVPPPPGWWPPAPGWWLLAALILLLAIFAVWWVWRHRQRGATQRWAKQELSSISQRWEQQQDAVALAAELSIWLRQVQLRVDPASAGLTGNAWLDELDDLGESQLFRTGAGAVLRDAQYRPQAQLDGDALLAALPDWLKQAARPR